MRVFHSVPGVPCAKMERFTGKHTQTCASPHLKLRLYVVGEGFWGEGTVCLCRTHVNLMLVLYEKDIDTFFVPGIGGTF